MFLLILQDEIKNAKPNRAQRHFFMVKNYGSILKSKHCGRNCGISDICNYMSKPLKKTLVLGASPNPSRYSYAAVTRLKEAGHEVIPVGIRSGEIASIPINTGLPSIENIDTITLYIHPSLQRLRYDYILGLKPKRILFNPGTENPELEKLAAEKGILAQEACTLVLLSTGQY